MPRKSHVFVFADTWSNGYKFIEPVCSALLKQCKCNIFFLHADSIYNNSAPLPHGANDLGVTFIDIKEFGYSFLKALRSVNGDFLITVSMHGLFHRWAVAAADSLGIKKAFFPHGIRISSPPRTRKTVKTKFQRALFYLPQFLFFARDIFHINPFLLQDLFGSMYEFYLSNYSFTNCPANKLGLSYDIIFLNVNGEKQYFETFIGNQNSSKALFVCAGNVSSVEPLRNIDYSLQKGRKSLLFFSQPLYLSGYVSMADLADTISIIGKIASANDLHFLVRPHPRESERFLGILTELGLSISKANTFLEDVHSANIFAGINSASLIGLVQVGLPVVIIDIPGIPPLPSIYYKDNENASQATLRNLSEVLEFLLLHQVKFDSANSANKIKPSDIIAAKLISQVKSPLSLY